MFGQSGIWFYGLAGSGKTFASTVIADKLENAFVIDGDEVRRHISFDLGYDKSERLIQLQRVFGLAELVIKNNLYPVISTVSMSAKILECCNGLGLQVVQIVRPFDQLILHRPSLYANSENVVGKQIVQEKLNTKIIHNDGSIDFKSLIEKSVE